MALRTESVFTSQRLRQGRHVIPSLLELLGMDVPYWNDDFMGDQMRYDATAPGTYQSTASGAAAATADLVAGSVGGKIRLDAGTDVDGRSDLSLGLHFRGDRNVHCWFAFTTPAAITSWKFELGLTDVVSGTDAGAIATKATPTANATDAVILVRDTTDDTNLTLIGVKNGTVDTAVDFSTALVAATDYYVGIELRDDQARAYLLDADARLIEQTAWIDDAVTATVLLTPWAFCQTRSTSNRVLDIDLLRVYQRRSAA